MRVVKHPLHPMPIFSPEDERPGDARCFVLSFLPSELCLPLGMPCLAESMSFLRFLFARTPLHDVLAISFGTDSYKILDGIARHQGRFECAPSFSHCTLSSQFHSNGGR